MSVKNWSIKSSSVKRLSNHYQTGLEVQPQTFREKLKKMSMFLDFYENDKGYLTARVLFHSTTFIFTSVSALIFWSSKNN